MTDTLNIVEIQNADDFLAFSKNTELFIIDFYADWCAPCQDQGELIEKEGKTLLTQFPKLIWARMDTDHDEGVSNHFKIRSIPTLLVGYKQNLITMRAGVKQMRDIGDFLTDYIHKVDSANTEEIRIREQLKTMTLSVSDDDLKVLDVINRRKKVNGMDLTLEHLTVDFRKKITKKNLRVILDTLCERKVLQCNPTAKTYSIII